MHAQQRLQVQAGQSAHEAACSHRTHRGPAASPAALQRRGPVLVLRLSLFSPSAALLRCLRARRHIPAVPPLRYVKRSEENPVLALWKGKSATYRRHSTCRWFSHLTRSFAVCQQSETIWNYLLRVVLKVSETENTDLKHHIIPVS